MMSAGLLPLSFPLKDSRGDGKAKFREASGEIVGERTMDEEDRWRMESRSSGQGKFEVEVCAW